MTGAHGFNLNELHHSLCSHIMTPAKTCIDLSKRCCDEATQARLRKQEVSNSTLAPITSLSSVYVEVRIDLFVYSTMYPILKEVLHKSMHGPLHLHCRNLHVCMLPLCNTVELLELLNATGVRMIELYSKTLDELNTILPVMVKFRSLRSLKLLCCFDSIQRPTPGTEDAMKKFTTIIRQLRSLKELNLRSSSLAGCLQQLLGGIQEPLESLELGHCDLLPVDLYYLSKSLHISTLKKLDLRGHNLSAHLLLPFLQLLAAISSSLLYLDIRLCWLSDHTLSVLVPALCRCSHLRCLVLSMNPLSFQALKSLFQNCLQLQDLQLVVYSYPQDCYVNGTFFFIDTEKRNRLLAELQEILAKAGGGQTLYGRRECPFSKIQST
ncbi:unnamed protein product [Staurois parvus]|uniref:Leucine-rich repeat-containing protein 14 n=1 Tax=Staurois parvus TaxID=386267 RepID=A0ABN9ACP6_9NEOB|nr:unnamed protein product [Staurois parvus]